MVDRWKYFTKRSNAAETILDKWELNFVTNFIIQYVMDVPSRVQFLFDLSILKSWNLFLRKIDVMHDQKSVTQTTRTRPVPVFYHSRGMDWIADQWDALLTFLCRWASWLGLGLKDA